MSRSPCKGHCTTSMTGATRHTRTTSPCGIGTIIGKRLLSSVPIEQVTSRKNLSSGSGSSLEQLRHSSYEERRTSGHVLHFMFRSHLGERVECQGITNTARPTRPSVSCQVTHCLSVTRLDCWCRSTVSNVNHRKPKPTACTTHEVYDIENMTCGGRKGTKAVANLAV